MKKVLFLFVLPMLVAFTYAQQPNIIYIMSDDHDADAISAYNKKLIHTPNLDRLAKEGMLFNKCFVGNSICSPARATVLTGQHSHKNGIKDNRTPFDGTKVTLPKLLQQAGYQTALIGKWHLHSLPTGFDYWKILPGQGVYYDPLLINMNGDTALHAGYATEVITNDAIAWLKEQRDQQKPFLLMLHHKAPHRNWVPLLKYLRQWHHKKIPEPSTLYVTTNDKGQAWKDQKMSIENDMHLCSDLKVDPKYIMDIPWLKPDSSEINYYKETMDRIPEADRTLIKEIYAERGRILQAQKPKGKALLKWKYQWYMQDYLACVASIDENIGKLLNYLDESGLTKNSVVIYTSDQGFYLGENGWFDKRFMYDVSMQTPLLIRWPGHIKPLTVNDSLVQNIDFAPTMLDIAGVQPPSFMQGVSLKDILLQKKASLNRYSLYYHYYEYPWDHNVLPHLGIRQQRYKLIYFYTVNEWELYDLQKDPAEQHNLIHSTAYKSIIHQLKGELQRVRNFYEDDEPVGILK